MVTLLLKPNFLVSEKQPYILSTKKDIDAVIYYRKNSHTFCQQKKTLMQSSINAANGHILKSQTVESFITSPINTATHARKPRRVTCQLYQSL